MADRSPADWGSPTVSGSLDLNNPSLNKILARLSGGD
jgi:hypothetical protein